jgi:cell division protein FtsL
MTEYHTVKRIDNSRLSRPVSTTGWKDLRRRVAVGGALGGCLLFYAWQHFACIQIRYQIEQLESQRTQSAELNQQLQLEVATLRSPVRVDAIARKELGLTVPVPGQMVPVDAASDGVLAQVRTQSQAMRP